MAFTGRFTIFFDNLNEGYGWSETLWAFGQDTYAKTAAVASSYMQARIGPLANQVIIKECRISDDSVSGDSELVNVPVPSIDDDTKKLYYNPANRAVSPCPVDVALNVSLRAGPLYRGTLFMGGVPNIEVGGYVEDQQFSPAYTQIISRFLQFVVKDVNFIGIKVLPKGADVVPRQITNIVFGNPITVTCPAHGFNSGDSVRINGVRVKGGRFSCSNLPITVIDVGSFTLPTYNRAQPTAYVGGGTAAKLVKQVSQITDGIVRGITHRKRGRVFDQRRGKART